jgi:hypothetical protein
MEQLARCNLGYGWLSRAALWLECERWYVGTTVPEGGVGGVGGRDGVAGCPGPRSFVRVEDF